MYSYGSTTARQAEGGRRMNRQNTAIAETPKPFLFPPLTWKGFAWAAALPGAGALLFHTLVLHTRIVMGRWPHFNESLPTRLLSFHDKCVDYVAFFLFASLYVVPVLVIASLCFRRSRHVAVYIIAYSAFVMFAGSSIYLAPHEFLNWFLD